MLTEVEERLVLPFYLSMMSVNAIRSSERERAELVTAARTATAGDVADLLAAPAIWRPTVMGAWFSLFRPTDEVRSRLLRAVAESNGSLTAPPLVVASMTLVGAAARPAIDRYLGRDVEADLGSATFVRAALRRLDGVEEGQDVGADHQLTQMLEVARSFVDAA